MSVNGDASDLRGVNLPAVGENAGDHLGTDELRQELAQHDPLVVPTQLPLGLLEDRGGVLMARCGRPHPIDDRVVGEQEGDL